MSNFTDRTTALLDKPSLEGLSYALRHPEVWPEGFVWDYDNCKQCAMGLCVVLNWTNLPGTIAMRALFGISIENAFEIFYNIAGSTERGKATVTPAMVASVIDSYLATT